MRPFSTFLTVIRTVNGQFEADDESSLGMVARSRGSSVRAHRLFGNRQAESDTAPLAVPCRVDPEERIEQPLERLIGHTRSAVAYHDGCPSSLVVALEDD